MKDLRDLKDLTIHDVKPLSVPQEANATAVCTLPPEKLKAGWQQARACADSAEQDAGNVDPEAALRLPAR